MSQGKGIESANNDARKWPILPFDVSRDFIISSIIVIYGKYRRKFGNYIYNKVGVDYINKSKVLQGMYI